MQNQVTIGKEPVSGKITQLPGPSTHSTYSIPGQFRVPRALFERGFYFLITINAWPSIWEGLLFEGDFYSSAYGMLGFGGLYNSKSASVIGPSIVLSILT